MPLRHRNSITRTTLTEKVSTFVVLGPAYLAMVLDASYTKAFGAGASRGWQTPVTAHNLTLLGWKYAL